MAPLVESDFFRKPCKLRRSARIRGVICISDALLDATIGRAIGDALDGHHVLSLFKGAHSCIRTVEFAISEFALI
jgi:hypothetical protein